MAGSLTRPTTGREARGGSATCLPSVVRSPFETAAIASVMVAPGCSLRHFLTSRWSGAAPWATRVVPITLGMDAAYVIVASAPTQANGKPSAIQAAAVATTPPKIARADVRVAAPVIAALASAGVAARCPCRSRPTPTRSLLPRWRASAERPAEASGGATPGRPADADGHRDGDAGEEPAGASNWWDQAAASSRVSAATKSSMSCSEVSNEHIHRTSFRLASQS